MKYLILSSCGLELFLVPRLGKMNDVEKIYFWHMDTHYKSAGQGMENYPDWEKFELVSEYTKVLNDNSKNDLVILIGDVGLGDTGDYLRKQGYKVIGGGRFTDRIEEDRDFAGRFAGKFMKIPPTTSFDSFDAGVQFLKSQDKTMRFVFKPNDSMVPKEYTYVSKDINDMLSAIKDFKAEWKWKESFQLQEVIKGTEVDFSAYFNGREFIENSLIIYFENKPFMDGNVGPATGGSIAVEFAHKPQGIFWEILTGMAPYFAKAGYKGQVSVNSIVSEDDKQPYFLEFCGRFGYPSLPMDVTLVEDNGKDFHDLLMAMVNGENKKTLFPTNMMGVTISVFVPPAPTAEPHMMEGTKGQPIGWSQKWDIYFFPYYIKWDEKKGMVLAGINTWVLQITCADQTLAGAIEMLYKTYVPTLKLKNAMYRSDLGEDAKKRIQKLRDWGLL